ncbi:MAG: hypothetical protein GXO66_08780 [Euryarchaeota archaeon]|nr:hypothetical protein [Euryarchaeota archaeon]
MDNRAQITVEALIILGAILLIILSVSVPTTLFSGRVARDVQHAADARYAVEQIAAAANSITSDYERRVLTVYIPGYTTAATATGGEPLQERRTVISTDGDVLKVWLSQVRRYTNGSLAANSSYSFSVDLQGTGWRLAHPNGTEASIVERSGAWYNFTITYKNITFSRG